MNIQGFFTKQIAKIFNVDGILKCEENIHLTRQGISNNDFAHTHKFKGLLENNTLMEEGDLVIVDDTPFLVMAMRKIQFLKTNQANLWLCDDVCSISSYENAYQGNIKIGTSWVAIKENVPCVQRDTNGKVKYFDAGLLESTTKLVYMQYDSQIELGQRLSINGKNYQVDSIDTTVKNILCLQLSPDKRK
jgi:hypothetical protein